MKMKLYVTKPIHSKYGRVKIQNPFKNINDLINNSSIWFYKPTFEKPFIDIFDETFYLRGWNTFSNSLIPFKYFPEGEVKDYIYEKLFNSIDYDFHESIKNRYYNWLEIIDVELNQRTNKGNFDLYLIKPKHSWDIQFAGIDRTKVFLQLPDLKTKKEDFELFYIEGKFFRITKEVEPLMNDMWKSIKNSFNIEADKNFLNRINDFNHKPNQGPKEFLKVFHCDLILKKS